MMITMLEENQFREMILLELRELKIRTSKSLTEQGRAHDWYVKARDEFIFTQNNLTPNQEKEILEETEEVLHSDILSKDNK